jgi:signal transduction histidine kinase
VPRRLLREPHLLAHELRTPLTLLAGWYSLMSGGEVDPFRTPKEWQMAMEVCQRAVERLNVIIRETCDEAETRTHEPDYQRYLELADSTRRTITRSEEILATVRRRRRGEP